MSLFCVLVFLYVSFWFVVQSVSPVRFSVTPRTAAHQASLSFTISWSLLKFVSIESVMLSNHLILRNFLLIILLPPEKQRYLSQIKYHFIISCCPTEYLKIILFSSVQLLSRVWLFAIPWTAAHQAFLSITNSQSLPKFMSIESVMPSSHLILCHPLLLLPSIFPSIRVFSNKSALHIRWTKDWSFNFNINPSNEHPGLVSFRMDWLDLLAVQGTLKSLLQHHSSKTSNPHHSAFFTVQLLHPYMTTGKTIALTGWTFLCKVTSLLFNMLSLFYPVVN